MTISAVILALAALPALLFGYRIRQTIKRRRRYAPPRVVDYRALPKPSRILRPPVYTWPKGGAK